MRMIQLTRGLADLEVLVSRDYPTGDGLVRISEDEMEAIRKRVCECIEAAQHVGLGISLLRQTLNIL